MTPAEELDKGGWVAHGTTEVDLEVLLPTQWTVTATPSTVRIQ